MSSSDSKHYDLYFAGECLEGHAEDAVRAAVGKLFKADTATLERLFSGQRQRIKRGCDEATALRYQKAMTAAGARLLVAAAQPAQAAQTVQTNDPHTEPATATAPAGSAPSEAASVLSVAPAGSDVLRPEERHEVESVDVDLDHLSMGPVGEDLGGQRPAAVPAVEAPDLDVAALGTDLDPSPPAAAVAAPDTSGIDLSPADYDLSDCQPSPAAAPDLDLDGLSLSEPGSDLLTDAERHHDDAVAPDTSHLDLDTSDKY